MYANARDKNLILYFIISLAAIKFLMPYLHRNVEHNISCNPIYL